MLLEPQAFSAGRCPRHKLRAYGRIAKAPVGAEYKRLLNFLSKTAAQSAHDILQDSHVPDFAQVGLIINRRICRQSVETVPLADEQIDGGKEHESNPSEYNVFESSSPAVLQKTVENARAQSGNDEGEFIAHLSTLLNEWFNQENSTSFEEADVEPDEMRILHNHVQARRILAKFSDSVANQGKHKPEKPGRGTRVERGVESGPEPAQYSSKPLERSSGSRLAEGSFRTRSGSRNDWLHPETIPLANGLRCEIFPNGSFVIKDAVGRVEEVRSQDGVAIRFSYDQKGHLKEFVRIDACGKIDSTGERDKHGVIVRDADGRVRAQGDSMSVDPHGCVSIRKFDGQFWTLDVMRGIHVERHILEDVNGDWSCLTALLTCDGFRMVTRFQNLKENNRANYRRFGDWLHAKDGSTFRFYGRDGSMIQFDKDEDLQALSPTRIWPPGSRDVDREWLGCRCPVGRQAGTAWASVHQYISQYLSAL